MVVPIGLCAAGAAAGDSVGSDRTFVDGAANGSNEPKVDITKDRSMIARFRRKTLWYIRDKSPLERLFLIER